MNMMLASCIALVSSLVLTVIFIPLLIKFMRSHHEGQEIRDEGPKWHQKKSGTPTMGGTVFVIAAVISVIWVAAMQHSLNKVVWILVISLLGYGIIGFLDDGIKLYQNYPEEFLAAIKDSGIDLVTTANNHMLDMGYEGVLDTIDALNRYNIDYVGTDNN